MLCPRIERETELATVELKPGPVVDVLKGAIQTCAAKAQKKNIALNLECDNNLTAPMDRLLLEQAVVNLIDNAINYSDENKPVYISAVRDAQTRGIAIRVKDEGSGIVP